MNKVILFTIPHLYGGGAERVVSLWASQLAQTQHYDVHILVSGRVPGEYVVDRNVNIHAISSTYENYEKLSILTKLWKRRSLVKQIKPDYIISFLPHIQIQTLLSTIGLRIKRVETIRVSPWVLKLNKINKILFNYCLKTSHKIILQTQEQGEFFSQRIQKKCIVIPNPLDDKYNFHFKESQSEFICHFMAVGRIVPQKNYSMMINAFSLVCKEFPAITLDIFGEGDNSEHHKLEHLINQLGMTKNIHLKGRCSNMIEEYIGHDVFLMTSNFEGMPNALLEAMASGMVCLSTNCKTGPKDMITHGDSGFLSPVNDIDSFVNAIKHILRMSLSERLEMGKNARKKITSICSPENTLQQLKHIFNS